MSKSKKPYQPFWVNGTETGESQRECATRYEAIKQVASKYHRRFSVLDIGCNYAYFDFRLLEDFDCVPVVVDTKPLRDLIDRNEAKLIWLAKRVTAQELYKLSQCESFDIVLALSVIHHFDDWQLAVDSLLNLGKDVIIELPGDEPHAVGYENQKAIRDYVLKKDHELLLESESHVDPGVIRKMVLLKGRDDIHHQTMDWQERDTPQVDVLVLSDYQKKTITIEHKRTYEERPFIHGMNLWNFKLLNGQYPAGLTSKVKSALNEMDRFHDDLRPWNFIIDGEKLHPIDFDDKTWRKEPELQGFEKCCKLLNMDVDYKNEKFTELFRTA